jgi:hypothetical protein
MGTPPIKAKWWVMRRHKRSALSGQPSAKSHNGAASPAYSFVLKADCWMLNAECLPHAVLSLVGLGRLFLGARRAPCGHASGGQAGLSHDELQDDPDGDDQQNGSDGFHELSPL